ncbi:MAG: hypothetical protein WAT17_02340 [Candidatus Saccharimonadales bacterium]
MATTNTTSTGNHATKSELDKFTLFFETVPLGNDHQKARVRSDA